MALAAVFEQCRFPTDADLSCIHAMPPAVSRQVIFIESICRDEGIITDNIIAAKVPLTQAVAVRCNDAMMHLHLWWGSRLSCLRSISQPCSLSCKVHPHQVGVKDYKNVETDEAMADFRARIETYSQVYEELTEKVNGKGSE